MDPLAQLFEDVTTSAPPAWKRRSIVAFVEPTEPGKANPANVVFVREAVAEGETVHSLVEKELRDLRELPGFRVLGHRLFDRDGAEAVELAFEWVNERGPLEQTSTFMVTQDGDVAMVTSMTTTCTKQDAGAMQPVFSSLLGSLRPVRARTVSGIDLKGVADDEEALPEFPMPGRRAPLPFGRALASASPSQRSMTPLPSPLRLPFIPIPGVSRRR